MGSIAKQSGRPHGSDGSGASGISKNKISKIRKNSTIMWGEGEVGGLGVGGAKVQAAVLGRGGTGCRCSAREETAGRSRWPLRGDPGFEPPVENSCLQQPEAWERRCR